MAGIFDFLPYTDYSKLQEGIFKYLEKQKIPFTGNQLDALINSHAKALKTKKYAYDVAVVSYAGQPDQYMPVNSPDWNALLKIIMTDTGFKLNTVAAYLIILKVYAKKGIISMGMLTPSTIADQQNATDNKIKFYVVSAITILGLLFFLKK